MKCSKFIKIFFEMYNFCLTLWRISLIKNVFENNLLNIITSNLKQ